MFANVLIKFFTERFGYENKEATQMTRSFEMTKDLTSALKRARGTLAEDAAGLAALVGMLVVGLNLPTLF